MLATPRRLLVSCALAFLFLLSSQRAWAGSQEDAIRQCDTLASDPRDPDRFAAPVPEDHFAPGLAIAACKAAVDADPTLGRSWFQLGRAYWLGERDADAFAAFVEASKREYAPAMKYIGDAYKDGRGLPDGEQPSPETALGWYKKARSAGFRAADQDIVEIQTQIAALTFRPELFQNPSYMTRLYSGDFNGLENPIMFFSYTHAFLEDLGGTNIFFMDKKCTAMVTALGSTVNTFGQLFGYLQTLSGDNPIGDLVVSAIGSHFTEDQGRRDAVILMDNYKCDSPVARRIIDHVSGSYNQLPTIVNAFVNSKQQLASRRSALLADIESSCERTFSRPGFCPCAVSVIAQHGLDEDKLSELKSDFHMIGHVDQDHALAPPIRACFHNPA